MTEIITANNLVLGFLHIDLCVIMLILCDIYSSIDFFLIYGFTEYMAYIFFNVYSY